MYNIKDLPRSFSREQICAYIEQYQKTGDLESRNRVIEHNIRLTCQLIQSYNLYTAYETEDLVSIVLIHLMEHLSSFDTSRGTKFSSWLRPVVLNCMSGYISKNNFYINMEHLNGIVDIDEMQSESDLYTIEAVIEAEKQYYKDKKSNKKPSFDTPIEYGLTLEEKLPSREDFLSDYIDSEMDQTAIQVCYDVLQELPEINRQSVSLYFGLYGNEPHSYRKIANLLNISHELVGRIIKLFISKVGRQLKKYGYEIENQKVK